MVYITVFDLISTYVSLKQTAHYDTIYCKGAEIMPKTKQTIKELFELWKKQEGHQFFCEDGIIDNDTFNNETTKLLFVAKESNVPSDGKNDFFWLKAVAFNKEDVKKAIASFRISLMANAYFDNEFTIANTDHNVLKRIAYMNINKRGGTNKSVDSEIEKYASDYRDFITREIELISPKVIFCCSPVVYKIIKSIVKNDNIKLLNVHHPSNHYVSYAEVLKNLKNELER